MNLDKMIKQCLPQPLFIRGKFTECATLASQSHQLKVIQES